MPTQVSEVATIRQQIMNEHLAGKLGFEGLAVTSRHSFITARQERVALLHEQLHELVGDGSIALVNETLDNAPETATRSDVLVVLHYAFDHEEIELLCNDLQKVWQILDLLRERFGDEPARKMILAPPTARQDISPS